MLNINEYLDSTFLKTPLECKMKDLEYISKVESVIQEAIDYNFKLVMLRLQYIPLAIKLINDQKSKLLTGTVIDFPFGNSNTVKKIELAQEALNYNVDDVDCVVDYKCFQKGDNDCLKKFQDDIYYVSDLVLKQNKTIKWIIETGALEFKEINKMVVIIRDVFKARLHKYNILNFFIKTSTGYYRGTGAKIEDVKHIFSISEGIPIKASGGIYNTKNALEMINNGASRIGTSKALDIILNKNNI